MNKYSSIKFFDEVIKWGSEEDEIFSILVTGSYARNDQTLESDIDLIIITKSKKHFISNYNWINRFGKVVESSFETWGTVETIRVFFENQMEVEFGIATEDWCRIPVDQGTFKVVNEGHKILVDKEGLLEKLINNVTSLNSSENIKNQS